MELPDNVDNAADLRKYDKYEESPKVRVYKHKKSRQEIWVDATQEEDKIYIYGDIPRKLQAEDPQWDWKMEFMIPHKAITVARDMTDFWDEQYEEPEDELTEAEKRRVEEDILDVLEENDDRDGNGVSYETVISESKYTGQKLKDGVNRLLSDGTIYEPRPNHLSKL